ncbi:alcohol dehydrogenase catalytic domain-containing protein [soil metagenome]
MKAIVVEATGGLEALQYRDVDAPQPASRELLIKVAAAGVCSHDIAMRKGVLKRGITLPFIPGHEISGTVVQIGQGVSRFAVGDRVATTQRKHVCGVCAYCRSGRETYCEDLEFLGHGLRCGGGYAQYVTVGEENVCLVPDTVSMADASIAACAIGSSLNAVRDVGRVKAGESVLVTGAGGGLGIHALQVARVCGAKVYAVTSDPAKVALLEEAGADVVITCDRGSDFSAKVREATGGRGVDVVIDNVGTPVFNACRRSLAKEGRWVLVGELAGEFVPFNPAQLILNGNSMHSVHSSTRAHLQDCLNLLADKRIRAYVDCEMPLADAPKAHSRVEKGLANGRVVLTP